MKFKKKKTKQTNKQKKILPMKLVRKKKICAGVPIRGQTNKKFHPYPNFQPPPWKSYGASLSELLWNRSFMKARLSPCKNNNNKNDE